MTPDEQLVSVIISYSKKGQGEVMVFDDFGEEIETTHFKNTVELILAIEEVWGKFEIINFETQEAKWER